MASFRPRKRRASIGYAKAGLPRFLAYIIVIRAATVNYFSCSHLAPSGEVGGRGGEGAGEARGGDVQERNRQRDSTAFSLAQIWSLEA